MEIKNKIETKVQQWQWLAPILLRIGIGTVFLLFGVDKFLHMNVWSAYMPQWLPSLLPFSMEMFMYFQGTLEAILGLFLIIGFWSRTSAFICALILFGIIASLGINEITIRDFGLLMGSLALSLREQGKWSVDAMMNK